MSAELVGCRKRREEVCALSPARPRLLLCAFAEQPVVGVLNTLEVKTRHAAGATLRIRQDGEDLFDGEIPPNAEIGIVPATPSELVVSLTLEPAQVVHNFRVKPQVAAPVFSKIDVARQGFRRGQPSRRMGSAGRDFRHAANRGWRGTRGTRGDIRRRVHAATHATGSDPAAPRRARSVRHGRRDAHGSSGRSGAAHRDRARRFNRARRERRSLSTGASPARARHSSKRRSAARLTASNSMAEWSSISRRRQRSFIWSRSAWMEAGAQSASPRSPA